MKHRTPRLLLALAALLTAGLFLGIEADANNGNGNGGGNQAPSIPVGSLSAFPTIVQTGTKPQLTWDITLPETVEEIIEITPPGTITPKREVIIDVRILGAGVTAYNSYYNTLTFVPTEARISIAGGNYERIFYGTNHDVDPSEIVFTTTLQEGETINMGARYYWNNSWGTWFSTTNHDYNVVALKHGDMPPTTTPMHQAPTIESFIRPYLDENGRVELGPRDVIYLFELTHTNRNHGGWDLQDMAVLIGFYEEVANNNGHGNNVDGVDSSNPGNAPFEDSDPNTDDEQGSGGANANNDDDDDDDDDDNGRGRGRRKR